MHAGLYASGCASQYCYAQCDAVGLLPIKAGIQYSIASHASQDADLGLFSLLEASAGGPTSLSPFFIFFSFLFFCHINLQVSGLKAAESFLDRGSINSDAMSAVALDLGRGRASVFNTIFGTSGLSASGLHRAVQCVPAGASSILCSVSHCTHLLCSSWKLCMVGFSVLPGPLPICSDFPLPPFLLQACRGASTPTSQ